MLLVAVALIGLLVVWGAVALGVVCLCIDAARADRTVAPARRADRRALLMQRWPAA